MDSNAFAGLITSLTEIASFLRELTAEEVAQRYGNRASNKGSPESKLDVADQQVLASARDIVALIGTAPEFMTSLNRSCFGPYREALEDFSTTDDELRAERERVRRCALDALGTLRDNMGGVFQLPELERLWSGLAAEEAA